MSGALRQLQHAFMNYLNTGTTSALQPHIIEQGSVSVDTRMAIYRNAYRVRLRETIETDHEVLGIYLGDELFEQMVSGYIERYPSKVVSLRDYCDDLPLYLSQQAPFAQYPIVADIAAFERRLLNAFDAPDAPRLSFTDLQQLPAHAWPNCQLRFHPSLQLFCCQSNAVEAWQNIKANQAPAEPDYGEVCHWLIWRGEARLTEFISLAPYQYRLIMGFVEGQHFAGQCESMLAYFDPEVAPQQVLSALQAWFEMGLIIGLEAATKPE